MTVIVGTLAFVVGAVCTATMVCSYMMVAQGARVRAGVTLGATAILVYFGAIAVTLIGGLIGAEQVAWLNNGLLIGSVAGFVAGFVIVVVYDLDTPRRGHGRSKLLSIVVVLALCTGGLATVAHHDSIEPPAQNVSEAQPITYGDGYYVSHYDCGLGPIFAGMSYHCDVTFTRWGTVLVAVGSIGMCNNLITAVVALVCAMFFPNIRQTAGVAALYGQCVKLRAYQRTSGNIIYNPWWWSTDIVQCRTYGYGPTLVSGLNGGYSGSGGGGGGGGSW